MIRTHPTSPGVSCIFGRPSPVDVDWPGPHHCAGCAAAVEAAVTAFAADVAAGRYNESGYTPAEWKATLRREADAQRRMMDP